jgi:hypothetical protein
MLVISVAVIFSAACPVPARAPINPLLSAATNRYFLNVFFIDKTL